MGDDIGFLGNGRVLQVFKAKRMVGWGLHLEIALPHEEKNSV